MSSIVISGDTSGSVTLQAPAVAGSTVLNLPSTSGTIQTSGAGYTTNGVAYATSTSALATGSALTFDGTNLGVGATSLSDKLTVGDGTISTDAVVRINGGSNTGKGSGIRLMKAGTAYAYIGSTSWLLGTGTSSNLSLSTTGLSDLTLDTAGNLGLGVTPQTWSSSFKPAFQFGTMGSLLNGSGYTFLSNNWYQDASGTDKYITTNFATNYYQYNGTHVWRTTASGTAGGNISWTTPMTLDASGNLLVGTTTSLGNGVAFQPNGSDTNVPLLSVNGNSSSNTLASFRLWSTSLSQNQFYVGYGGTIYARSTSITGLSDISEKENIRNLETGLNSVLALQPRRFDWKNGSGTNVSGFIAQEVQSVLPDLVESYKISDEENKLGLKMGDMIPTLVKAIQEQQALITTLTDRITALEGV